jgi:type I site-specific restriction-modification system R (restriction) subunit
MNHSAIAEEVTVTGADAKAHTKRPDLVLYVNGIALGVLELKRSTVSVAAGIRQNLDNQKKVNCSIRPSSRASVRSSPRTSRHRSTGRARKLARA